MKPPFAISIWVIDDFLYAELPASRGATTHTIHVKATPEGLSHILSMLKARNAQSEIGSPGDPTQWQLDLSFDEAKVKRVKPKAKATPEMQSAARAILRELGML